MANDLPTTIDDLTDSEFRSLMRERALFIGVSKSDLLWSRYLSLSEEAHRLEARSVEAWDTWWAAAKAASSAHDEAIRVARDRPSAYPRAQRAYRTACEVRDKAEAARDRAERAAVRMRKRADAVHAALESVREERAES